MLNLHLNNNNHFKEKEKEETVFLFQAHQILILLKILVIVSINNVLDQNKRIKIVKQKIHKNDIEVRNSLKLIYLSFIFVNSFTLFLIYYDIK